MFDRARKSSKRPSKPSTTSLLYPDRRLGCLMTALPVWATPLVCRLRSFDDFPRLTTRIRRLRRHTTNKRPSARCGTCSSARKSECRIHPLTVVDAWGAPAKPAAGHRDHALGPLKQAALGSMRSVQQRSARHRPMPLPPADDCQHVRRADSSPAPGSRSLTGRPRR